MSQSNNHKPNHNHNQQKNPKDRLNSYARYSGIVIQMVAIICAGTFIGIKLDERYPNDNNLYTLFFTLTFVIGSIVFVIRRIIATSKDDK